MSRPQVRLSIAASAADFIRRQSVSHSKEMALIVFGVVLGTPPNLAAKDGDKRTDHELAGLGRDLLRALPPKVRVKWAVGVKELDRLPKEDIYVVDGVACYLPEDMLAVIGDRSVVLDQGDLRFDPDLEPFEIDRPSV